MSAARAVAWSGLAATTVAVDLSLLQAHPIVRMLALVLAGLLAMKVLVLVESRLAGEPQLGVGTGLAFAFGWIGMQPARFARRIPVTDAARATAHDLLWRGTRRLVQGAALIALARVAWTSSGSAALATLLVLPGLSLMLHFGLLNLLAGAWRLRGAEAGPWFRAPLRSHSLAEFWGRRWNLPFAEMSALAVVRPARAMLGSRGAATLALLVSGALHEMALSLPVRAGFGLPMLYFALHALALHLEPRWLSARTRTSTMRRAWTLAWLILPAPLLFHPPFLAGVVWPLIGITSRGGA